MRETQTLILRGSAFPAGHNGEEEPENDPFTISGVFARRACNPEDSEFDGRFVVAGTSEGGVSVARFASHPERPEAARLLFSWSCEDNYHVEHHRTNIPDTVPVLNLMSAEDKFFSRANAYLGNDDALGHAGKTLAKHSDATIVLLPGAPRTLFNLPAARRILRGFLEGVLPL